MFSILVRLSRIKGDLRPQGGIKREMGENSTDMVGFLRWKKTILQKVLSAEKGTLHMWTWMLEDSLGERCRGGAKVGRCRSFLCDNTISGHDFSDFLLMDF